MSTEQPFIRPDPLAAAAAAATVQLEQLKADYAKSPDAVAARARQRIDEINSGVHAASSQAEVDRLQAQIRAAERAVPEAMTEAARISNAISGIVDANGIETTVGQQIPTRDFTSQIQDDLALGIRPELIKAFYETGRSNDPEGHIHAAEWFRRYNSNSEWQQRHAAGDPEMCRWFRTACIYAAGAHAPR